ncbi:uncharacterized protein LOC134264082 [Saccostrea cucullata]|uniref:uncharacterized protein LOC134264082 n=1 Tax=Saccostrea cuccullata TaxID=36930 RepID=UPI002ED353E6
MAVLLVCVALCWTLCECSNRSQLFKDVLDRHEARVAPYETEENPLDLSIFLSLMTIREVNEKKQTIANSIAISLSWLDERLMWDSSHYNGITSFGTTSEYVWTPKSICIINEVSINKCFSEVSDVIVRNSGIVTYTTYRESLTLCQLDITKYPFDEQKCMIFIGRLYQLLELITLNKTDSFFHLISFNNNEEWEVLGSNIAEIEIPSGQYGLMQQLHFILRLKRKSAQAIVSIIIPLILLSIINIFCFMLPIASGEKMGTSMAIFLTYAVLLSIINDSFPTTDTTPYFIIYLDTQLTLSGLTVIFQVVVIHRYFRLNDVSQDSSNKVKPFLDTENCTKQPLKHKYWKIMNEKNLEKLFLIFIIVVNVISFVAFIALTREGASSSHNEGPTVQAPETGGQGVGDFGAVGPGARGFLRGGAGPSGSEPGGSGSTGSGPGGSGPTGSGGSGPTRKGGSVPTGSGPGGSGPTGTGGSGPTGTGGSGPTGSERSGPTGSGGSGPTGSGTGGLGPTGSGGSGPTGTGGSGPTGSGGSGPTGSGPGGSGGFGPTGSGVGSSGLTTSSSGGASASSSAGVGAGPTGSVPEVSIKPKSESIG